MPNPVDPKKGKLMAATITQLPDIPPDPSPRAPFPESLRDPDHAAGWLGLYFDALSRRGLPVTSTAGMESAGVLAIAEASGLSPGTDTAELASTAAFAQTPPS